MKRFLKIATIYFLYRLKLNEPLSWKNDKMRWTFVFIPRKWNILFLFILFSPINILVIGIMGLIETYKNSLEVKSWSSYSIILDEGKKPSKFECYDLF